jgi:hypothetical protein
VRQQRVRAQQRVFDARLVERCLKAWHWVVFTHTQQEKQRIEQVRQIHAQFLREWLVDKIHT